MKNRVLKIRESLPDKYLDAYLKIGNILLSDNNVRCAILSGSVIENNHGKTSDLDIIVISKRDFRQRKQLVIDSVFIEIFCYSKKELYKSFKELDYHNMNMVGNGFVMFGDRDLLKEIRKKAKILFKNGPKELNKEEKTYLRYLLWDSYCDVIDILDINPTMAFSLMHKYVWYALEVYYKINSLWFCKSKKMLSEMKIINKDIYKNLIKFYSYPPNNTDKMFTFFKSIIKIVISPHNIDKAFIWESKPRKGKYKL